MAIEKIIASLPSKSIAELARMRANAGRLLAKGGPVQTEEAEELIREIDAEEAGRREELVAILKNMPTADRVREAFIRTPPTEAEEKAIRALLDHPGSTSAELSAACGWGGQIWHTHFGAMCHARELYLWPAERSDSRDASFYSGILAEFAPDGARFTMRAEAAAAFARLGMTAQRRTKAAAR